MVTSYSEQINMALQLYQGYVPENQLKKTFVIGAQGVHKRMASKFSKRLCEDWSSLIAGRGIELGSEQPEINKLIEDLKIEDLLHNHMETLFAYGSFIVLPYTNEIGEFKLRALSPTQCLFHVDVKYVRFVIYYDLYGQNETPIAQKAQLYDIYEWNKETRVYRHIQSPQYYDITYPLTSWSEEFTSPYMPFTVFTTALRNPETELYPYGILYGNYDLLNSLDRMIHSLDRELELGKKRILASAGAFSKTLSPITNTLVTQFDTDTEIYQGMDFDEPLLKEVDFHLRVDEHLKAIDKMISFIAGNTGLDDEFYASRGIAKTATEVISEHSATYKMKSKHQIRIKEAVINLIGMCAIFAKLPPVDEEKLIITFDDAIIKDDDARRRQAREEVMQGLLSKKRYLMEYRGLTEEEADVELAQIGQEFIGSLDTALLGG